MVQEEKVALEQQLAAEKHGPESCFIEAALQELKVRGVGGQTVLWRLVAGEVPYLHV